MMRGKSRACTILSAFLGTFLILAVIIAYSQYLTLKKTLIAKISDRAAVLIGQKVGIGDISLSTAAGITVRDIVIHNPEGFTQGDLLRIDRVHLGIRFRELFRGRFSFRGIEVDSPELTLIRGRDGKLNVTNAFLARLSKKGTTAYRVDELNIRNARFSFDADPLFAISDADLTMSGLSSAPGTRTTVKYSMSYMGSNRLTAGGWVFLNDGSKQFSVNITSEMTDLSLLARRFPDHGISMGKSRVLMSMHAEGDMARGVGMKGDISIKGAGLALLKKDAGDISLSAEAFLAPGAETFTIGKAVLRTGEAASVQMKGSLRSLLQSPSYEAEVRVDKLDLSAFTMLQGMKAEGMVNSDLIRIRGDFSGSLPEAAGSVSISNGSLSMENAVLRSFNGKLVLVTGKDISLRAEAAAELQKAGDISFRHPAAVNLSLDGKGKPEDILISSKLMVAGIDTAVNGKRLSLQKADISFTGKVKQPAVSGDVALSTTGLTYENFGLKNLSLRFGLDHKNDKATVKGLVAESEVMKAGADTLVVTMPDGRGIYHMEGTGISASYPEKKAELSGLDCRATLRKGTKDLSGDIAFSLKKAALHDARAGVVSGKASFDGKIFAIDIPAARFLGGTLNLSAKGAMQNGPYPVQMNISAEHLDLGQASGVLRAFAAVPYRAAGELGRFSFAGTAASAEDVTGRASLNAKDLSVINAENRSIVKGAVISSDMVLRGRDADFRVESAAGSLVPSLSGTIARFGSSDRSLRLKIALPATDLNDIRTAFWDIFPDTLLYAGLGGSIGLQLDAAYGGGTMTAEGSVLLRDITVEGENNEYAAGPMSGTVPVHYDSAAVPEKPDTLPSVEQADFGEMKKRYSEPSRSGGSAVRLGSVRYGFRLLQDISLRVEQRGRTLNISGFSAKMFGGRLTGAASIDLSSVPAYQAGLVVDAVSLTQLCEDIAPIRGYISGKVNGIAAIRGTGSGLAKIIGKADFWTYSDREESTRISREFLEKIGGPQVRAYLGERRFNKGIMNVYIQNGFLIFKDLEISNRNLLGMTDLSVKVAPLNNRIAIDHLMWTITEAAQRAKKE